jgi:spermidine synthase
VLIGGLGLGFTLKATLAALPKQSEIVVGELMPQIVEWVRVHMGSGALLDDRRVRVELGNVADLIRRSTGRFDAILLDVDNGPDALCIKANHVLYGPDGLAAAHRALKPGGRLAIWASSEDPAFVKRFGRSGFDARAVRTRSRRDKGARHVIFVGDALESEARGGDAPASRRPRAR